MRGTSIRIQSIHVIIGKMSRGGREKMRLLSRKMTSIGNARSFLRKFQFLFRKRSGKEKKKGDEYFLIF